MTTEDKSSSETAGPTEGNSATETWLGDTKDGS